MLASLISIGLVICILASAWCRDRIKKSKPNDQRYAYGFAYTTAVGIVLSLFIVNSRLVWVALLSGTYFLGTILFLIAITYQSSILSNATTKQSNSTEHEDSNRPR